MQNRGFFVGVFISRLGDSFSFLAFMLLLLGAGSNSLVSLFLVARYGPGVALGLLGKRLFDRLPKRRTLIAAYLASAALTFAAAFQADSPWGLLAISLGLGIAYGIYVPLQRAILPDFFPESQVRRANSLVQTCDVLGKSLGFALAGVLFRAAGAKWAFAIDGLSFFGIAIALCGLRSIQRVGIAQSPTLETSRSSELRIVATIFALAWLGTGTLFALEASYAKVYLGASEVTVGLLFAIASVGSLAAPYVLRRLPPGQELPRLVFVSFFEMLFVAAYAMTSTAIPALAFIFAYGLLLSLRHIFLASWIHLEVARERQGSAFAFQQSLANFAMILGMGASGFVSDWLGLRATIVGASLLSAFGMTALLAISASSRRRELSGRGSWARVLCPRPRLGSAWLRRPSSS